MVGGGVNAASLAGGSRWRMEPSSGVEVGSRGSADQLQALDAEGKQLSINLFEGNNTMSTSELQLEGGRSKIFVLGEKAATLVLHKDGKEVRRAPLALAAGQLNRVQF